MNHCPEDAHFSFLTTEARLVQDEWPYLCHSITQQIQLHLWEVTKLWFLQGQAPFSHTALLGGSP